MPSPLSNREELLPSLLDRLLDDRPDQSEEPQWHDGMVVKVIKQSLRRDVQQLLNANCPLENVPEHFQELRSSLLNYGLPSLQSLEVREDHDLTHLCKRIELLLIAFEPRLENVRVFPHAVDQQRRAIDRSLRFIIEAVLVVEPLREAVRLSSSFDTSSGEFLGEGVA